ncbi:hypothetical protein ACQ86G_04280 [Roseateles chitinivorans]|uniref:hypothetical protein n=1 Tax=Roseateles chitinivorans TaxID=2917965 RepID=UPI003D6765B0
MTGASTVSWAVCDGNRMWGDRADAFGHLSGRSGDGINAGSEPVDLSSDELPPRPVEPRLGGYEVIDCEIKDRGVLYLLMREDVDQMEIHRRGRGGPPEGKMAKRLIGLRLDEPERPVGVAHVAGLGTSRCAMAFAPEGKVAIVDSDSKVWMQSTEGSPFQPRLPFKSEGGVLTGGISRVRSFGAELIACTRSRQMLVRRGRGLAVPR